MITSKDYIKYNGFKLISLELRETSIMGKNPLYYKFVESHNKQENIYTTVLIGANGTGKSNLFRIIIGLFKEPQFSILNTKVGWHLS